MGIRPIIGGIQGRPEHLLHSFRFFNYRVSFTPIATISKPPFTFDFSITRSKLFRLLCMALSKFLRDYSSQHLFQMLLQELALGLLGLKVVRHSL